MKTLVVLSALLVAVMAGHHASPRAYSSGSHGRTYGYSLPSGHVRVSSYAKSHHYAPRTVKYVHKPIVKVVEVPKTVYKHVPKVVEKVVEVPRVVYKEKVIVKEVPREVIKEVPRIVIKEVPQVVVKHVPVVKEVEVPQYVVKHVPVTQEVRVAAAPVAVHAAPAVRVAHTPVAVAPAPAVRVAHTPVAVAAPVPAVRVAHTPVAVAAAPVAAAFPYAAAVSSQHHAQDELGQYDYGFSGPLASKQEVKTADGVVRGQYSYVDANGQTQVASYFSDARGFHVARSDLPVAPVAPQVALAAAVQETPEVAAARADHLRAHAAALEAAQE